MSQAGNALLRGVDAEAVAADLDRLRAAHVVAEQWLLAVENRLALDPPATPTSSPIACC